MTEHNIDPSQLSVEDFSSEHTEAVGKLLLKFLQHPKAEGDEIDELGLSFQPLTDGLDTDAIVNRIFDEHPELEVDRQQVDEEWWSRISEEDKKEVEGNEQFFEWRKKASRLHVVSASPFVAELRQAEVQHHLENPGFVHRSVVKGQNEVLGYLAVWTGASTLYIDGDHVQIDAKVVDPGLSLDDQRVVVAQFEPILYDLSLP